MLSEVQSLDLGFFGYSEWRKGVDDLKQSEAHDQRIDADSGHAENLCAKEAEIASQEDVNVVGLSSLSGGHDYYWPRVAELLKDKGMKDVLVIGGGIIPQIDIPDLKSKGIAEVFGPGSRITDIASFIRGMREFGSHTPESESLASTLDKLWHDNLRLASQALTDSLTGLLNRRGFLALSSQICALMRRSGSPVGVLMLDVDRFKSINDRFGHKRGDEILALVARALESSLRESDLVGRYGGDEFVVLMPDIANPEQIARKVADTINRTLYDSCDLSVSVGASGGLIDSASVSQSLEGLISEADVALYRAKRDGGRSVSR